MPDGSLIDLLDPYGTLQIAVQRMLNTGVPQFEYFGQQLVLLIISMLLVVFMARLMLGAHHAGSTSAADFVTILVKAVVTFTIVRHYRTIIPGFEYSFVGAIDGQFHSWMVTLGRGTTESIYTNFDRLWAKFVPPTGGIFSLLPVILYCIGLGMIAVAKALTIYATMYGLIGQALTRLFGAPMLAFLMVPRLNQLSWNWIWTYLNYGMLPVVGMAYIFIMNSFIAKAVSVIPDGVTEIGYYTYLVEAIVVMLIFVGGIPLIRQVCSQLTGGSGAAPGMNPFR
jgi:hypothetical protein